MSRIHPLRTAAAGAAFIAAGIGAALADDPADRFLPPLVIDGDTEQGVWLYGQLNKGLLVHDDGQNRDAYVPVDNGNSGSRFGAWLKSRNDDGLKFSANFEYQWAPYSTGNVNLENRANVDWRAGTLRKAEGILASDRFGRLWLGQGSMASDGSAETDLSGTDLVAYASVADSAGGQLLALSGGGLSNVSIGSAFGDLDGLGRKLRVRVDSPSFAGFRVGTSYGTDKVSGPDKSVWDVGGTYAGTLDGIKLSAAAAWARTAARNNRYSTSVSGLHGATGLNLTLAAGGEDQSRRDPSFVYAKLGWQVKLTGAGATAFSIDAYTGSDFANNDSDSTSAGIAAVQTIDYYRTDLYATVRIFDYDDPTAEYERAVSFLTGARFSF